MKINFNSNSKYVFYETEIIRALNWLDKIRDNESYGWAWVQFIKPNVQNTAEVIYAFAENEEWLKNNPDTIDRIIQSINYWLLNTEHSKISIDFCWVIKALQRIRICPTIFEHIDSEKLQNSINYCFEWLLDNSISTNDKEVAWGDNSSEIGNVIRTSLAITALNEELTYYSSFNHISKELIVKYEDILAKSISWLVSIQNNDGGWGNLNKKDITAEYQNTHTFSFEDLKYQCDSNAACTGYAMLALESNSSNKYHSNVKNAFEYLKKTQSLNGSWPIFTEIGIRDGERYTFRHFSTAWALQGMLIGELGDYRDECVIHGFEYLSELQDSNYGGWRSSPDADNYTWATCNALSTINLLKDDLREVHAKHFLNVVWDWWIMKKKDTNYNFTFKKVTFAFNGAMALLYCITFTVMITLLLAFTVNAIDPILISKSANIRKLVLSVLTVFNSVILGLPWIVYVKNKFKKEVPGWIDSIGWVYGIIAGFVLVLYQFIL